MAESSDLQRLQHPRFARFYLWLSNEAEKHGVAEHRDRLLAGLGGRVVEVGAGNGLNFGHYPPNTENVLAVEPDSVLRAHAEENARHAPVPVEVVAGQADALPLPDGSADAAVFSLVLCTVANPAHALAEAHRVLRPGGELRFYEHVRSRRPWMGLLQDAVTPLWARLFGGCHPNRDTRTTLELAGFGVAEVDQFGFSPGRAAPSITHVLGRARRR
jgi:ubiquinone/menaquinone biosynthesis C-methylase UbiE